MLAMIEDIERAADAGAYRSAMALALTIPDICGQIAFPECENNGTRYRRWFNKYVRKFYPENRLLSVMGVKTFDAHACYKLRCAYLHSGNSSLSDVEYIRTLDFFIHKDEKGYLEDQLFAKIDVNTNKVIDNHIRLNIAKLCAILCAAGREFCKDVKYTSALNAFDICIYDAQEEITDED